MLQNTLRKIRRQTGDVPRTGTDTRTNYRTVPEFKSVLESSKKISNVTYRPAKLTFTQLDHQREYTEHKYFKNVSFSFTEIIGIDFKRCTFVDCEFVGTKFIDCEFHKCVFESCEHHKISFVNTYIDPQVFVDMYQQSDNTPAYKVHAANKGLWLFQQLLNNAVHTTQNGFARVAEFNKRKWERYQLTWEYTNDRIHTNIPAFTFARKWLANISSWLSLGYGVRPKFLFIWALPIFILIFAINYLFWDCLELVDNNQMTVSRDLGNVINYTLTSHVGVNIFVPASFTGETMLVIQSGFGLITTAVFIGLFVRAALR